MRDDDSVVCNGPVEGCVETVMRSSLPHAVPGWTNPHQLGDAERQILAALADARESLAHCQRALERVAEARRREANGHDQRHLGDRDDPAVTLSRPDRLTSREIEVLRLIAAGNSNRRIAVRLFLSQRTVERHVANIYLKIDAHSRAEATRYALRHNLA